jgi:conjugative transfer region protein (TIGR03750 family)
MSLSDNPDLLGHRLNFDPIIFCGCTLREMQVMGFSYLVICILMLGILFKCLINLFLVGVGLAFPVAVGLTWMIAQLFQRVKQGKPKGYWKQKCLLFLQNHKLLPEIYVCRSGYWSAGRNLP